MIDNWGDYLAEIGMSNQVVDALDACDLEGFESVLRAHPRLMMPNSKSCIFRRLVESRRLPVIFLERFFDIAKEHGIAADAIVYQPYGDVQGGTHLAYYWVAGVYSMARTDHATMSGCVATLRFEGAISNIHGCAERQYEYIS